MKLLFILVFIYSGNNKVITEAYETPEQCYMAKMEALKITTATEVRCEVVE